MQVNEKKKNCKNLKDAHGYNNSGIQHTVTSTEAREEEQRQVKRKDATGRYDRGQQRPQAAISNTKTSICLESGELRFCPTGRHKVLFVQYIRNCVFSRNK